jgi:hypothetical protein
MSETENPNIVQVTWFRTAVIALAVVTVALLLCGRSAARLWKQVCAAV